MNNCKLMTADEIFEKAMATMAPLPSQESCARDLAAIFSFHLAKMELMDAGFGADELPQQHAIMVAPTGSGKTYLLRHIAKACGVNVVFMDGSSISRDGWKGASFGQQLLAAKNAFQDSDAFSRSVVFVDEADKMRLYGDRSDAGNVMDNLLQLFNGGEVSVEIADKQIERIDVSRFTVIMGGAFAGLEDIIRKRMAPTARLGFGASAGSDTIDDRTILHHATPEDLQVYGMKKELIARIGSIIHIDPLEMEDYRRLLTAEVGSVQANYRNYFFHGYGVGFDISDEALQRIAEQCSKVTTGARAVTPIINEAMREAVAAVNRDTSIKKVVLSANEEECIVCYEYGDRDMASIGDADFECDGIYRVTGKSIMDICTTLFEEYLLAGCSQELTKEFGQFVHMTLVYLFDRCQPAERSLDSLRKLARATDKSADSTLSPCDIIISDYLQRPDHNPEMDKWFKEFRRMWTPDTAQHLCRALTMIRRRFMQEHRCSDITFHIPPLPDLRSATADESEITPVT